MVLQYEKLDRFYCGEIPDYVVKAHKSSITINLGGVYGVISPETKKITIKDICEYYAYENPKLSTMKSLAGHIGDHRQVSYLAEEILSWFKYVNMKGLKAELRKYKHIMTPHF